MNAYQTKPHYVDAVQWNQSLATLNDLVANGMKYVRYKGEDANADACRDLVIETSRGGMAVEPGSWIVRHPSTGLFSVWTDAQFRRNYDALTIVVATAAAP
jgi:hypothetical protein